MDKRIFWMSAVVFCGAIAVGCGDDDSASHEGADGGDSGTVDGGGTDAGGGGAPGTGGMSAGTGGTMAVMTVKCGTTMCMAAAGGLIPGVGAPVCCADEATNQCGMMMGGACMPPPKVDPSCPTITIPIVGMMGSCCAKNGMCGLDGSALGMGCVDYEMVKASLGILGGVITLPEAQSCGSDDHDAGTNEEIDGGK